MSQPSPRATSRPLTRSLPELALAVLAISASLVLSGCGGDDSPDDSPAPGPSGAQPQLRSLPPPPCPPDLADCRTATGRIAYVERVDPDGDGDAHFVLLSRQSITAPGISVIDVRRELRPTPLPGPGDQLAAAGQVQTGSYGQRQIHAIELRIAP